MVKSEIVAIILSDVHLGAIGSNKPQFTSFLKRLISYPKHHLILAGDLMDLMCEPISQIDEGAEEIFRAFQALQEKGTEIYMILGNHEIPVVGPYETASASLTEENFRERLAEFKLKLSIAKHFQTILPKIKFGQYALLENSGNDWEVRTYDSLKQVQGTPASGCHALVAHGFQFDRTSPERCETWKNAIEAPDSLKDIMDFFFNGAMRPIKNVFSPSKWEAGPEEVKTAIQTQKKLQKHSSASSSLIQMIDEDPTQVQKFSREYLQTISKRNYGPLPLIVQDLKTLVNDAPNLHVLSHVLFGHTHDYFTRPGTPTIINTGAWQHVRKMTYIEVDNAGFFHAKYIHSRSYWLFILLGGILAITISLVILQFFFPST